MAKTRTVFRLGELVEVIGQENHAHKLGSVGVVVGKQNTIIGMLYHVKVDTLNQLVNAKDLRAMDVKKITCCDIIISV
jgi:hypothetical protein